MRKSIMIMVATFILINPIFFENANAQVFSFKWGSPGGGDGQFNEPVGIAIDSSGNVYISDHNSRIQKFDMNGTFLLKWGSGGNGDGQFLGPLGIGIDSSNNVYVADWFNNRVQKFDSDGNYLTQWGSTGNNNGEFNNPHDIAVDSRGAFLKQ
jgi:tripartite motif-containing protein 71